MALKKLNEANDDDAEEAARLKELTFAERRRMIVHAKLPLARLKEKCRWLFSHDEVSCVVMR